ncbi:hypothetical protein L208DRAFT_1450785 [Tricholoma matsutake]|nr:hypothetical protein L208DRAFT_1450785 [Tricholoma matsutake 945]
MVLHSLLLASICISAAHAHMTAWGRGMYCMGDTVPGVDNQNANEAVQPLWNLTENEWWMHHVNKCDQFPPAPGDILNLPAGGNFTVEIAANRAFTTLSYEGRYTSNWGDGQNHPSDYNNPNCIGAPNMHTQNRSMAAGTAFAISYQSDLAKVTQENLVVFTVRYHTPWMRVTSYDVPAAMPACPPGGCICAWGWIPNGCGEPNMYQVAWKCNVTNPTSTVPVAMGKPPVWCEDDQKKCTEGPKQMIYWNQEDANNIKTTGCDQSGHNKSPGYNKKCGFAEGPQNDIFMPSPSISSSTSASSTSSSASSSSTSLVPSAHSYATCKRMQKRHGSLREKRSPC